MYLLTYEYRTSSANGPEWLPNVIYAVEPERFDFCTASQTLRNVELFERRGNDWIRIRPEDER